MVFNLNLSRNIVFQYGLLIASYTQIGVYNMLFLHQYGFREYGIPNILYFQKN